MAQITLRIEHLVLDVENPRITHAEGQQQALQKIIRDQKTKIVRLAQSIVEHGLSPIERLMVLQVQKSPKRYIALEGNRRVATLRLLTNPAAMTALDMPGGMQKSLEKLAAIFDASKIEPIACFEVPSREAGRYWLELRHNGENEGRGTVGWAPIAAARFREKEPAMQALDLVTENAGLSEAQVEKIRTDFPLTTLRRLFESKEVRRLIGVDVKNGTLTTTLPASELMKPFKRMVLDLATKKVKVGSLMKTTQMTEYIEGFGKADTPDLSKKVGERPVEGINKGEFARARTPSRTRSSDPADRKQVVPKGCPINVTDNRIAEIYKELRTLKLEDSRNAIGVLLRVFLELSVDHFLEKLHNKSLRSTDPKSGKSYYKKLDTKLQECVDLLVAAGAPRSDFTSIIRSLSVPSSPMYIDLLHSYIHDRHATPSPAELTGGWNNAQGFFERIWP